MLTLLRTMPLLSFLADIDFIKNINDRMEGLLPIGDWVAQANAFFEGLMWIEQVFLLFVLAIIIVLGTFSLIKKLTKLIIVIAILVGLYILFTSGII